MGLLASFLTRLIRALIPYAWLIIIGFVGLSYFAYSPAVGLIKRISTNLSDLLPETYPSVKFGNEVKEKFKKKGGGDLILILESPDPKVNQKLLVDLAGFIERHPEVEQVKTTKKGYDFFDKYKLLYMELGDLEKIKERVNRKIQQEKLGALYIDLEGVDTGDDPKDPFTFDDMMQKYREEYVSGIRSPYYTNEGETIFAMWIYPKNKDGSLRFYQVFYEKITAHINTFNLADYGSTVKLHYAGSIQTRLNEYTSLMSDLNRAGIISLTGIFLLLILFFRSVVKVILIFIPLISGILLAFAFSSFYISTLNVITSFLFSILFGLGVDVGIHMMARYVEDREAGVDKAQCIVNILLHTGRSSSIAVFTTTATFLILMVNDFRGFSEFGFIAGYGLLIILATYLIFFPAIIVVAEQCHLISTRMVTRGYGQRWKDLAAFPYAKKVLLGSVLIFVVCLATLPFIGFEWDYGILRMHVPETELAKQKLLEVSGRVNSPAAVIINNQADADAIKQYLQQKKDTDQVSPTIDKFKSSYDLFPEQQSEKITVLQEIDQLLSDDALNVLKGDEREMVDEFRTAIAQTQPFREDDIPNEVSDAFFGIGPYVAEQVAFVYPLPKLQLDDGRNAIEFFKDVHTIPVLGKVFHAVSDAIVYADVLTVMFADSRNTVVLCLVCLFILIFLDFRSLVDTALIFLSIGFGIVGMMALTHLIGWKFNFFNMIMIPAILGMGEDNSVHILHRFKEEGRASVMRAVMTSGVAAVMASLTTMLGYAGLLFAHHTGLRSIGVYAVVGMGACMLGSILFFPALLEVLKKER